MGLLVQAHQQGLMVQAHQQGLLGLRNQSRQWLRWHQVVLQNQQVPEHLMNPPVPLPQLYQQAL